MKNYLPLFASISLLSGCAMFSWESDSDSRETKSAEPPPLEAPAAAEASAPASPEGDYKPEPIAIQTPGSADPVPTAAEATPAAAPAPAPVSGPSARPGARLRGRPTPDGPILATLPMDAPVELIDKQYNGSGKWWRVRAAGKQGWMNEKELRADSLPK